MHLLKRRDSWRVPVFTLHVSSPFSPSGDGDSCWAIVPRALEALRYYSQACELVLWMLAGYLPIERDVTMRPTLATPIDQKQIFQEESLDSNQEQESWPFAPIQQQCSNSYVLLILGLRMTRKMNHIRLDSSFCLPFKYRHSVFEPYLLFCSLTSPYHSKRPH